MVDGLSNRWVVENVGARWLSLIFDVVNLPRMSVTNLHLLCHAKREKLQKAV
jgi:hypothetical protein